MRVVVTGGAGFVGKHVLLWLQAQGHSVLVLDDFSTGRHRHIPAGVDVRTVDLTIAAAAEIAEWLRDFGAEGVVHLAAMHFIPDCMARPERTFAVNSRSTHTLIEALELHPVQRFVLASTMDVYGNEDVIHKETDALNPSNVYGLSKALSEQIVAYGKRRDLYRAGVALRLSNIYGPDETNPHLIPDVIERIINRSGNELVMGYLGASRDFIYVKEVADAFGRAVTTAPDGFHTLNVGTGRGVPVRHVVQTIQHIMGDDRTMRENPAAFRKFDRASLTPDVSAIAAMLGWRSTMEMREGLAETVRQALSERETARTRELGAAAL
jgi:UDP-glucose 4-epimerase